VFLPGSFVKWAGLAIERFDGFDEEELAHLAGRVGLPKALVLDAAIETVELFHQHWNEEKKNLPLYPDVISTIEDHLKTVPIYT
jgi:serine/threonine-protein kinase HipA